MNSPNNEYSSEQSDDQMVTPQEYCEQRFNGMLEDTYNQQRIQSLRDTLAHLKASGECSFGSSRSRRQKQLTWTHMGETIRENSFRNVHVDNYFLRIGYRKYERLAGLSDSTSRLQLPISKEDLQKSPEEVRDAYIQKIQDELKQRLQPSLYSLQPPRGIPQEDQEAWSTAMTAHWQERIVDCLKQWEMEDQQKVDSLSKEEETYQALSDRIKELRDRMREVEGLAKSHNVRYSYSNLRRAVILGSDSAERLEKNVNALEQYTQELQKKIENTLLERDEALIRKKQKEQEEADALQEAMNQPATPAPWFLHQIDPEKILTYGRKHGEGFGQKVAGKQLYLPGDKPVVGLHFYGVTSRYQINITTRGLKPMRYDFPNRIGKRGQDLLGLVEDPNWQVSWVEFKDGEPYQYSFANAKGIAHFSPPRSFHSKNWDGVEGSGPSEADLRSAHDFSSASERTVSRRTDQLSSSEKNITQEQAPSPEPKVKNTFSDEGKRYFKCSCCGFMQRASKSEYRAYKAGQAITLSCSSGKGIADPNT